MPVGVADGIARWLNADGPRVGAIITALVIFTGVGAALYPHRLAADPADGDEQSIAAA